MTRADRLVKAIHMAIERDAAVLNAEPGPVRVTYEAIISAESITVLADLKLAPIKT